MFCMVLRCSPNFRGVSIHLAPGTTSQGGTTASCPIGPGLPCRIKPGGFTYADAEGLRGGHHRL